MPFSFVSVAAGVIPVIAWALIFAAMAPANGRPRALVVASVVWGGALFVFTEGLSLFSALTSHAVAAMWTVAVAAGALLLRKRKVRLRDLRLEDSLPLDPSSRRIVVAVGCVVGLVALIAVLAPPNTWDSLVYHLSRVEHWAQNRGVDHYPTHSTRQLYTPVWAEYALLQFRLLTGHDFGANLIAWFSLTGSAVLVGTIVGQLGGARDTQLLAIVFAVTLPMAILQGSSTQNDIVLAFWLLCVLHLTLGVRDPQANAPSAALVGGACGLALCTKPTAYLFLPPILLWLAVIELRRDRRRAMLRLGIVAAVALAINAPYYIRNVGTFGHPFGSSDIRAAVANGYHGAGPLFSNGIRNAVLHVATPDTAVNSGIIAIVERVHRALGLDASDPRTTFVDRFYLPRLLPLESTSGNPLHFALIIASALLLSARSRRRRAPGAAAILLVLFGAFILFCIYLRWQPFGSRFHLPLFVVAAIPVALVVDGAFDRRAGRVVAAGLLLATLPWLVFNMHRPLITVFGVRSILAADRAEQYLPLPSHRGLAEIIDSAAHHAVGNGCRSVGLVTGDDDPEYVLWRALARHSGDRFTLSHVRVRNASARWTDAERLPPCSEIRVLRAGGDVGDAMAPRWAAAGFALEAQSASRTGYPR